MMTEHSHVLNVRRSSRRHLGRSTCIRCANPWTIRGGHSTSYDNGMRGCFPLCESCWSDLTPELRLPYYQILILEVWRDEELWPEIREAVLAGG